MLRIKDPVAWCEKHIALDYGKFDRRKHPWLVGPLRIACEKRGGITVLCGSVQFIKTLTAQLFLIFMAFIAPGRSAYYDRSLDAIDDFYNLKFSSLVKEALAFFRIIPNDRSGFTKERIKTVYGSILLLSAAVLSNRNSKTLERVVLDEAWSYDPGWMKQIFDRLTSYPWSRQVFIPSSGPTEGSELHELYAESTQRWAHWECPCCGEMMQVRWSWPADENGEVPRGGMEFRDPKSCIRPDGTMDWQALRSSVGYVCEHCEKKIDWYDGVLVRLNDTGRYISLNPDSDGRVEWFQYNAILHVPWPDLVELWAKAIFAKDRGNLELLENFVRKQLGESWSEHRYIPSAAPERAAGGYKLGEDPPEGWFTFITIDVQQDHYYFVARAWDQVTAESRLLACERVLTLEPIHEAVKRWAIPTLDPDMAGNCRVFLDGNYNTDNVRRLAASYGWAVFIGDTEKTYLHEDKVRRMYAPARFIDAWEGTTSQGSRYAMEFPYSEPPARNRLVTLRSIGDPKRLWTHADDVPKTYIDQLNSWVRRSKTRNSDNSLVWEWYRAKDDDHFFDCEKMQVVCASMLGIFGEQYSES
ncbi:MAG: terminase gpA endonuclease subunit [Verrucomicrobiota bacterium]